MDSMKRNTDNQFYRNLVDYLELKLSLAKQQLVGAVGIDDISKLQGRCLELSEMLKDLQRKALEPQFTGSFS
jgi:hypothetical protein